MIKAFYAKLAQPIGSSSESAAGERKMLTPMFLIRTCVSFGILVFLIVWLSSEALFAAIRNISIIVWLLVFLAFVTGHVASALKWRMMLSAVRITIRADLAIRAHGAGLFANMFLPSIVGGDVVRAALIIREQKTEMAAIALGSLADRLNDVLALIIMAGAAGLLIPATQQQTASQYLTIFAATLLSSVIAGAAFVRFAPETWLPNFLRGPFDKVSSALKSLIAHPAKALFGLLLSLIIQSSFVGLNMALATAIGIDSHIVLWMFAWPLAKLVALAPISLGGIGVREIALAGILAPFGIEASLAVAQSLSWEVVLIVTGAFSGLAVAMLPSKTADT